MKTASILEGINVLQNQQNNQIAVGKKVYFRNKNTISTGTVKSFKTMLIGSEEEPNTRIISTVILNTGTVGKLAILPQSDIFLSKDSLINHYNKTNSNN